MSERTITRRFFVNKVCLAAVGAWGAAAIRPRPASAAVSRAAANEKIVLGFIGAGGMGRSHFDRLCAHPEVTFAAVADPDRQRLNAAQTHAAGYGMNIEIYVDFREMLERHPDIDAVFVATPDHWHALATVHCLRAGKDVYCEKPLALTIAEGRAIVETARRYGRIVQVGTMQRSDQGQFRHVCELVRNGRIGTVSKAVCFFDANPYHEYITPEPPPDYLDWDFYLGPAPWRPFNRLIHPYNFRYFRDYSGGLLTDWGVHLFDIAQWGLGKDATSPVRIESESEMYPDNMYEFPRFQHITYSYGDVEIEWWSDSKQHPFEPGQSYGTKFYGSEGEICVNRGGYWIHGKDGKVINEDLGLNDVRLYASPGHHQDFFNAMRSRRPPVCDAETGHRATAISHLGNIAARAGRPVVYDPVKEAFSQDETASKLLHRPMRAPWRL